MLKKCSECGDIFTARPSRLTCGGVCKRLRENRLRRAWSQTEVGQSKTKTALAAWRAREESQEHEAEYRRQKWQAIADDPALRKDAADNLRRYRRENAEEFYRKQRERLARKIETMTDDELRECLEKTRGQKRKYARRLAREKLEAEVLALMSRHEKEQDGNDGK